METTVSLVQMLDARERRVQHQQALLAQYHKPLICFTMNICGPIKDSPLIRRGFARGRQLLRQQGLETPLNEYRLVEAWKDVVGPTITKYTTNLYIRNQTLYVHLSSSVLRQELSMGRQLLIRNLNAQVGSQVIVNIIFC